MLNHGWKKYINRWLLLVLLGFALSYASSIMSMYTSYTASTVVSVISSILIAIYFVHETFVLANSAKKIQKNVSSENLELIEKETGAFSNTNLLTALNVTSNVISTLSTTAKLLPILNPNPQGQFEDAQKGVISAITAANAACLLGNFIFLNVFPNRNFELSARIKVSDSSDEAEQGVTRNHSL